MKSGKLVLCLVAVLASYGTCLSAALAAPADSILVEIVPPNPAPGENTTINLNSYTYDLNSVSIVWSVNNKAVASGIGKKTLSVTAPEAGVNTNVVATLSLPDGTINVPIMISSSVMVLLWQADDSYVPPFYRGKAMPSVGSEVKVVAMPEVRNGSATVSPKNMTYSWKKDYTNNVDGSGYGKNFFVFTGDYLENSNNISVTASTVDQRYSTQAAIDIGATEPKILFYRNDSSMGTVWTNTLSNPYKIQGPETVEAVPYFISPKQILNPTLVWRWSINDSPITLASYDKNLMPLAAQSGTSGTSKLRLEIENQDKIFETAIKEMNIEF